MSASLDLHLATGATTVARVWVVERRDGQVMGFTDHDRNMVVGGVECRADTGLTARALQQTTGLSVDNTEAAGALSAGALTDEDLAAGRFDGAGVRLWLVNWANPEERAEIFRGTLGEITRSGLSFRAELRGLSDGLNQPVGLAYTRNCSAVLGDSRCRFELDQAGYKTQASVEAIEADGGRMVLGGLAAFDDRWFEGGRLVVEEGTAAGLEAVIRTDRVTQTGRVVELWQSIRASVAVGTSVTIFAGCDKRAVTCRAKFSNFANFRGFPHMPGDDWLAAYPRPGRSLDGGSLTGGLG